MKVLKIFGVMMTVALGIASCKKDVKDIPAEKVPVAFKRISKSVETYSDGSKETYTLTYDAKGRPAIYTSDSKKDVFDFQSTDRLLVAEYDLPGNVPSRTYECTLNEQGAITEMRFKNTAGVVTYTYTYTYNSDGYMTGVKGSSGTSSFEEAPELKDGNYIASKTTFSGGAIYNKQYLFNNVANKQPGGFYAYWPVTTLFGKPSKNLVVEAKTFQTNGNLYWHTKTNYTMANDGSVAKYTVDILTAGETSTVELTYE
ncbi:hypothetical protein LL912_09245 [Niabella sp. CC-SYL272]|uniref:hypothetical protein n=1 Tax=Niabella agricola TaxID=2891571 RepID=UPI001F2D8595|nr:hypothetical protein [Niabella agricola]MCF3108961.1 hypothetical protein [Niabella agricola]